MRRESFVEPVDQVELYHNLSFYSCLCRRSCLWRSDCHLVVCELEWIEVEVPEVDLVVPEVR